MPDTKRPLKVFLCHARADRDAVRALYDRLTKDGMDVWLDKEKLIPGQDWELEIRKAVREADVVVVCLSKQFNEDGFRQKEVKLALDVAMEKREDAIFIIPARFEECDSLESLKKWHWVDLFEEDGYQILMRALRARANRIGATLQIKKSWLPKITSPLSNFETPVEEKKSVTSIKDMSEEVPDREKIERENAKRSAREKEKNEAAAKAKREKINKEVQREVEKNIKKTKRDLRWANFKINVHYWLDLARIYSLPNTLFLIGIAVAISMMVYYSKNIPALNQILNPTSKPSQVSTEDFLTTIPFLSPTEAPKTFTPIPATKIPILAFTPTKLITATSTPLPAEITDTNGVQMALVPAGKFTMGESPDIAYTICKKYSNDCDTYTYYYSKVFQSISPSHEIFLDNYYIDKYEVTYAQYKVCVDADICDVPQFDFYVSRLQNPVYNDYPLEINWNMAIRYCEWRGGQLPTEAQWEKSARGTDGRIFPWGNEITCGKANYRDTTGKSCFSGVDPDNDIALGVYGIAPVGRYNYGKSPYGIYDMAGNVAEWVMDWYSEIYYQNSPLSNPLGPTSGDERVVRGGDWRSTGEKASTFWRYGWSPNSINAFRCVLTP